MCLCGGMGALFYLRRRSGVTCVAVGGQACTFAASLVAASCSVPAAACALALQAQGGREATNRQCGLPGGIDTGASESIGASDGPRRPTWAGGAPGCCLGLCCGVGVRALLNLLKRGGRVKCARAGHVWSGNLPMDAAVTGYMMS